MRIRHYTKSFVDLVKNPNKWYNWEQFKNKGLTERIFGNMEKSQTHLMRIDEKGKISFLGGYILAYSLGRREGTEKIIKDKPFEYRYIDPLRFAQLMEIHPSDLPETFDTLKSKNRKLIERVQFDRSLVYRINVKSLAYLSLPVVNQNNPRKLSLNELSYKFKVTGDEKYLEVFLDEVMGQIRTIVNKKFGQPAEIFGKDLLVAAGLEGARQAFYRIDLSRAVGIKTFIQEHTIGRILDFIREEDFVPRLIRAAESKIKEIIKEKNEKQETVSLEQLYKMLPEMSKETINAAYELAEGGKKIESLQTIKFESDKTISLQDITPDEHPDTIIDPAKSLGDKELVKLILRNLRPHEREIVTRYFIKGQTMKEIADEMDLVESRISQLFPGIIERVRLEAKKYEY